MFCSDLVVVVLTFKLWKAPLCRISSLGDTHFLLFFNKFIYLFIYFWLRWVFVAVRGIPLVAASGGYSSLRCAGFSLRWLLLLRSMGSRRAGSVVVARGLSSCGSRA